MLSLTECLLYLTALSAAYLLPGPDMALVVGSALRRGARTGIFCACGLAASRATHVLASGLGLSAVFAAHPLLFDGLRWLGAAYLLWLGWQIARSRGGALAEASSQPGWAAVCQGFLTNLLNPKAFLFCALFLPQFIDPARGPLAAQYALLGVLLVALGFLYDLLYALTASAVARRTTVSERRGRWLRLGFAGVFALLAGRLALA